MKIGNNIGSNALLGLFWIGYLTGLDYSLDTCKNNIWLFVLVSVFLTSAGKIVLYNT